MKPFTDFQKEEIIGLIEVRMDTVEYDPESATEFETYDNLQSLKEKIMRGEVSYNDGEKQFIIEELENRLGVFSQFNSAQDEYMDAMSKSRSLQNAIDKLS